MFPFSLSFFKLPLNLLVILFNYVVLAFKIVLHWNNSSLSFNILSIFSHFCRLVKPLQRQQSENPYSSTSEETKKLGGYVSSSTMQCSEDPSVAEYVPVYYKNFWNEIEKRSKDFSNTVLKNKVIARLSKLFSDQILFFFCNLQPILGRTSFPNFYLSPVFGWFPLGLHSLNTTAKDFHCPVIAIVNGL